jgi:hypothetical protein
VDLGFGQGPPLTIRSGSNEGTIGHDRFVAISCKPVGLSNVEEQVRVESLLVRRLVLFGSVGILAEIVRGSCLAYVNLCLLFSLVGGLRAGDHHKQHQG